MRELQVIANELNERIGNQLCLQSQLFVSIIMEIA